MRARIVRSFSLVWLAILTCWVGVATPLRAELVLDPNAAPFIVAQHGTVLQIDAEHTFDSDGDTVLYPLGPILERAAEGALKPVHTRHIGSGLSAVANVVRVPLRSIDDEPREWILAFNRAAGYYFQVHLVLDGAPVPADPLFQFNFANDAWQGDDVLVHTAFTMPPQTEGALYIVFESLNGGAPMTIETVDGYETKRKFQDLLFFAVVGLTVGLVTITVALMATLRRFVAIYYAGAVLSGLLVVLVSEHYLFALLPRLVSPSDHDILLAYAAVAGPVFALLFQRQFFADVGGTGRILGNVILAACAFCTISVIGLIEFEFYPEIFLVIGLAICIPLIAINGLVALFRGFAGRWPFFLGSAVYSASFIIKVLSYEYSSLISSREASLVLLYSLALEATLLSLTMFMQVRHLRFQKERALKEQAEVTKAKLKMAQSMSHAAHDIQQPLWSLRLALSSSAMQDNREQEFHRAIDYLESIVKRQLVGVENDNPTDPHHDDTVVPDLVEPFEMNVVLKTIEVMFAEEAKDKGLDFRVVACTSEAQANVFAVTRVVANLVSNAIKNTETGGVLIGCRRQGGQICLDVVDTGKGLSPRALQELRKPAAQRDHVPGGGLGLGIVRALCAEHSIGFDAQSTPGKGSCFRIRLARSGSGI